MMTKVISLSDRKSKPYVRFYKDFIECDFCGEHTRGRVYEGSQEIVCGACNATLWEFEDDVALSFENISELGVVDGDLIGKEE